VGTTGAPTDSDALPILASLANVTITVLCTASFGNAVPVVTDFADGAVAIAQTFITAACRQALPISTALTDGAVVVASAAAIACSTAAVLTDLSSLAVSVGIARRPSRHADIVFADLPVDAVAQVLAAVLSRHALSVATHLIGGAVVVCATTRRIDARTIVTGLSRITLGVDHA
jgi:hypothetical protein